MRYFIKRSDPRAPTEASRKLTYLVPLFIYSVLALCYFGTWNSWTQHYLGEGNDPVSFVWFIHWWPFAIQHHLNPFVSYYVWHPDGVNLSWTTSVPFIALLLWPITATAGPVLAFNVISVMAPALSAWSAFLLTLYLSRRWLPSLFAGYFFGFSSYEFGQLLGHLNLDLVFLIPVAVLLCVARVRGDLRRHTFVLSLAAMLTLQLGISMEILASLCLLGAMTWLIFLLLAQPEDRAPLWLLAKDIALTAPVVLALTAPYFFYMFKGMTHGQPFLTSPSEYSADPLNLLVPTRVSLLGRVTLTWAEKFTGNASEQGAYLGLPLLFVIIGYFRDHWRKRGVKAFLVATCALAIMSFGPHLQVERHITRLRLPWHELMKLPLINEALPTRFTMYVALCAAIAVGLWLSGAKTRRQSTARVSITVVAAIALLPDPAAFAWTPWPSQPFFQAVHIEQVLGKHPNVLILPFSDKGPGMGWQINAGMAFTQAAGYLGPDPKQEDSATLDELRRGEPSPEFRSHLETFCLTHNVDYIVIGPGTPAPLTEAITKLPWAQHADDNVVVVTAPHMPTLTQR